MPMSTVQYRQGDVLVTRVRAIPTGAVSVPADNGRSVLAWGEVTGHAHALDATRGRLYELDEGEELERRFLRVLADGGVLRHEEHAPLRLPAGDYQVTLQREYVPRERRRWQQALVALFGGGLITAVAVAD